MFEQRERERVRQSFIENEDFFTKRDRFDDREQFEEGNKERNDT